MQWLTVHPDDREMHGAAHVASFAETLETGLPVWKCQEMRLRTRDGNWVWLTNHFCHQGSRWCAMLRDLSEGKRIEKSLRDFLATTSHDARTPLSSIQVAAQLLRERLLNEEAHDLLTAIIASSRVLYVVVNNVMLTKHLDAGTCVIGCAPVALEPLIEDVLSTAQVGLARQAGTSVSWERSPLPDTVLSSEEHLGHLLLNLAVFCVQASGGSPVCIRVRFGPLPRRAVSGAMHELELEVAVRGGSVLSADELANLFDPLSRADPFAEWLRSGGGSGRLGLHVSRRLSQALGGDLKLQSDEEEGFRLCASVPVSLPTDATTPEEPLSDHEASEKASEQSEEETGLLPFLPPGLEPSESFASMNRKGSVASVADLLLTNSPQAFLVAEGDDLTYVSPGLLALLRYACRDGVPVAIIALVHPDERQQVLEAWKAARAQSSASAPVQTSVTFRCARSDGSYIWAQLSGCTTPSHLYAVLRDVSDRKALEESLRGFLACVMGDMRQPLAGVQAASELLAARQCVCEDEEARFLVAAITAACQMLLGIVTNVLSVRSLETGECRAENAPFSVRRMIESVLSVCRMSTAHRTDVNLLWPDEAEAQLPPLMLGDERLLSQCLQNLLTNGACPRC